jgi:DNA topoisomerase-1
MTQRKTQADGPQLVIVESPAKAKTINKYLGKGYVVKASMGHVRDLPERSLAIDVENNFQPTYEVVEGRKRVISELKKLADKAETVFLATDLDREGEAIAWHLAMALDLPEEKVRRVIFNEITEAAIHAAFAKPHDIDMDKVNAQQARRILDRIVGYELSPLLWKKIAKGLSAGRVQSVAVRMICDREQEIRDFIPVESWKITGHFVTALDKADSLVKAWREFLANEGNGDEGRKLREQAEWLTSHSGFRAELVSVAGAGFEPQGRYQASASVDKAFTSAADEAAKVAAALGFADIKRHEKTWNEYAHRGLRTVELAGRFDPKQSPTFRISDIQTRRSKSKPAPPFTTATLQQAAANQLYFATSRTMRIAQQLYEGVDLGNGAGPVGLITYMRTDSTNLSRESVEASREWIRGQYGERYLPGHANVYASRKGAQEAHEAIRSTDVQRTPESLKGHLTEEQLKLYDLIWRRFVACQMAPAEWDSTAVMVEADTPLGKAVFKGGGRTLVFDGHYKVLGVPKSGDEQALPPLQLQQPVAPIDITPKQCFTSPPPRYTEASLVKALEAEGIGRPSTYAAIIQTIQDRGYVEQIDRRFFATAKGEVVTKKLLAHFPELMDIKFTSQMEEELDKIEEAHLDWVQVLHEFYDPFHRSLTKAHDEMKAVRSEPSPYTCEACGKPMVYRWAKHGRFLSCSGYPECKTAYDIDREGKPLVPAEVETKCPQCGKPMVLRHSRLGPFLGCSGYPECSQTIPCDAAGVPLKLVKEEDIKETCEACGSPMAVKRKGRRAFLGCSNYPTCKNTKPLPEGIRLESKPQPPPEEAGFPCEKCGRPMVIRSGRRGKFLSCSGFPKCRNAKPIQKLEELKATAQARAASAPPSEGAGGAASDATGVPWDDEPPIGSASKQTAKIGRKKAAKGVAAPSSKTAHAGGKTASPAAGSEEFVALARSKGFGVTRFGKLYVEKLDGDLECPHCGSKMAIKRGPWGPFLSCEGFPKCKTTAKLRGEALEQARAQVGAPEKKPPPEPTDIDCDQCGAKMVIRTGRSGKFLGCSAYPKCRNTKPVPTDMLSLGVK